MRDTTLLRALLPFRRLSVRGVRIDEFGDVIVSVAVRGVSQAVSWAEHGARHTHQFDDLVTWLAQRMDKTSVSVLLGISWRAVGKIIERVVARRREPVDLTKLRAIAVDELSYRKGHRYLTLVSDLDFGRIIWGKEGKCSATLAEFFSELGPESCKRIEWAAIDMSKAARMKTTLPS